MNGKPQRILVINSDAEERAFLRTFLRNMGFEVFAVESVCQGIDELENAVPDIIIVDALSAGGETASNESSLSNLFIHKQVKNIPVVFISTIPLKTFTFRRKKFYRQLCREREDTVLFLEKPLQEDELIDSIATLTAAAS